MKLKNNNAARAQTIKKIFVEELAQVIKEDVEAGRIDENFLKHMKSAGKGLVDYYKLVFTNYAKTLDDMINQQMIPSAMGAKLQDEVDDLESPQEFKGEDPAEQADAVSDLEDQLRSAEQAAEQSGSDEAAEKVGDMADAAAAVEQAAEKKAGEGEGGGSDETKVKAAVLDLIDATNEKWDQIMNATGDENLKKSMEYMEKVALAERLMKEIRRQIHEMNNQNKNKRLINSDKVER